MQMEDDEIEAEAADEQEDSSGPRNDVIYCFFYRNNTLLFISKFIVKSVTERKVEIKPACGSGLSIYKIVI